MIDGETILIAHLGYPTKSFRAPMIYNPYFEKIGVNAVVMPIGVKAENYAEVLKALFQLTNIRGALVTMPHKVTSLAFMDEISTTARIAGACNAILRRPDGSLIGDMFDGEEFVRGVARKGRHIAGGSALVVGCGGVGSAIAASLAAAGIARLGLFDAHSESASSLGSRLTAHYPKLEVQTGVKDPSGFDVLVNATPIGMNEGDPLPMDVGRIASSSFVGEVVMKQEMTPFLRAAQAKGCAIQIGVDMLFEQIQPISSFLASQRLRRRNCAP